MLAQKLPYVLMLTQWAQELNPIISFPPIQGTLLINIPLETGDNVINTRLGKNMQGWILTDQTAAASIFRNAPMNNLTLTLNSSAPTTINLWVY